MSRADNGTVYLVNIFLAKGSVIPIQIKSRKGFEVFPTEVNLSCGFTGV